MSVYLASIKIVPIKTANDTVPYIYISSRLSRRLRIVQNQRLVICLGKRMNEVKVKISNINDDELQLSEGILSECIQDVNLPKLLAKHIQEKQILFLGPIIGLVTEIQSFPEDQEPHFGSIHSFCKELQQFTLKTGGFFYVFHYQSISDEKVKGYYFENDRWNFSSSLPLPDVIYNRIHSRRSEQTRQFKTFRSFLERFSIPMFNDRFLSKWEVYQNLILENKIHSSMPETRLLSQETFYDFLEQYQSVFIKPVHGSQGRNILKLTCDDEHVLLQTTRTSFLNAPTNKYLKKEVFYQLKPFLHNRIYIIQQGISLIRFENKTIDFRVLVHKNQQHHWEVTSLVARISADRQFVSNLAKGGSIMKPISALTSFFTKEKAVQLISLMKELAIHAAEILSSNTNGITGELGIDIGVDDLGKPWIIEVNSKPSKNFDDSFTKIRPSAKAIIQFCTKLALDGVLEMEE